MVTRSREQAGLTLIELMIVVAIIGLISIVAIPNFMTYQARSRRGEAFVNLAALARAQQSYLAENGKFLETGSYPAPDVPGEYSTVRMPWTPEATLAFAALGWEPEGDVYYGYDVNTGATGCTCGMCFTASAIGNVDADDKNSAVMYVHPDENADGDLIECPSGFFGFGTPVDPRSGTPLYKTVAVQRSLDQF